MKSFLSSLAKRTLIYGVLAISVYLAMILGPLATLESTAGLKPFDMRPNGYGLEEARELLSNLGAEGREIYLKQQLPLDLLYPALMALTLACLYQLIGSTSGHALIVRVGVVLSWAAASFDYAENFGVFLMLTLWPDLPELLVRSASFATLVKSIATTAAVFGLLALVAWKFIGPRIRS